MRDTCGDVVLLVAEHHLEGAHLVDQLRVLLHVLQKVGRIVHAGVHADRTGALVRRVARAFDAFPADLEEQPLLRVHQLGFLRVDAEERCVEHLDVVDDAACPHVVGVGSQGGVDAGVQRGVVEEADGIAPGAQVVPELLDIRRAGEAPGHGDQRNRFLRVGGCNAALSPRRCMGRWNIRAIELGCQGGRGRILEKHVGRQRSATGFLQFGQHRQHQQRVAAQIEKVVGATHPVDAQAPGEGGTDAAFGPVAAFFVRLGQVGSLSGRHGQRAAVELAVGQQRHGIERDESAGHHVGRQQDAEVRAERFDARRTGHGEIRDQANIAGLILSRDDHGMTNGRMLQQGVFDLAQFDAVAADLDLMVGAAEALEDAVRAPTAKVAGAIERGAWRAEPIGDKTLGGQFGPVQVAERDTGATDEEFTHHTHGQRLHVRIEHMELGIGDRAADGHDGVDLLEVMEARPDSGFGRAVAVPELLHHRQKLPTEVRRQRLAGADRQHSRVSRPTRSQQQAPGGGRCVDEADVFALDQSAQHRAIGGL